MCVNISARLFLSSDPNSKKVRDMLEKLSEEEKLQARNVCERILLDNHQFSDRWIEESGLKLLVVENVMHPGGEELENLSKALKANTSGKLIGVSILENAHGTFPEKDEIMVKFTSSIDDMDEVMALFSPFNFLLFSEELSCAILFLKELEIKFIVGSLDLLQDYDGDVALQKKYFEEFRRDFLSNLNNSAEYFEFIDNAYSKMDWIS